MSTHPCAWASAKGRELRLSCPERVTLWQLAERAASKGFCWPSFSQLMGDTGLSKPTLVLVVKTLAKLGLIRIEKDGQRHVYHVAAPVKNFTDRSTPEPTGQVKNPSQPVKNFTGDRLKSEPEPVKNLPPTGKKLNRDPNLKRTKKRTLKGVGATRVAAAAPDGRVVTALSPESKEPSPAPRTNDTTLGRDEFSEWLDDGAPPDRAMHLEVEPEEVTEDDRPKTDADRERMAAKMAAQSAALQQEFRDRADALRRCDHPKHLMRDEYLAVLEPSGPKPRYLPLEILAAHRAQLMAGADVRST